MLRRVVLLVRELDASCAWYAKLGLRATRLDPAHARLESGPVSIHLLVAPREAELSTGYSPVLHLEVPAGELDSMIPQLLMGGARLDGAIQRSADETVAVIRSPDGHFVTLFSSSEPAAAPHASTALR